MGTLQTGMMLPGAANTMSHSHRKGSESEQNDFHNSPDSQHLTAALRCADAYPPGQSGTAIVVHETHVSWVFLAGAYAYKVKKPITTGFP